MNRSRSKSEDAPLLEIVVDSPSDDSDTQRRAVVHHPVVGTSPSFLPHSFHKASPPTPLDTSANSFQMQTLRITPDSLQTTPMLDSIRSRRRSLMMEHATESGPAALKHSGSQPCLADQNEVRKKEGHVLIAPQQQGRNYGSTANTSHIGTAPSGNSRRSSRPMSISGIGNTMSGSHKSHPEEPKEPSWGSKIKTALIFIVVVICSLAIASVPENERNFQDYSVSDGEPRHVNISWPEHNVLLGNYDSVMLIIRGAYLYPGSSAEKWKQRHGNVTLLLQQRLANGSIEVHMMNISISLSDTNPLPESLVNEVFKLDSSIAAIHKGPLHLVMFTESNDNIPFALEYRFLSDGFKYDILLAALILVFVYILICFELVHRSLAAIIGSLMVVALMSAFSMRPKLLTIISWIDFETVILLFGMMLMVSIFCETGVFDWVALQAYKLARGRPWPLTIILCVVSAVISAFLDNVTTILLLTPMTIRLCEALRMDPRRMMIAEVLFSNIGGTATGVGDPPNVIIVSSTLKDMGVNFTNFTLHLSCGIFFVTIAAFGLLWVMYRNLGDSSAEENYELVELHREIEVWRRTAYAITIVTKEEATVRALLLEKVSKLENTLANLQNAPSAEQVDYRIVLADLEKKYTITNKPLLVKSSIVMVIVIITFFVSSFVKESFHLELGWVAFLGAVWLLVLADFAEMESLLDRVEWATLIFFAALFTLMEGLEFLGLITWIGDQISNAILSLPVDAQFPVAIVMIVWVSALASAFIDNIPFTTAMIPVVLRIAEAGEKSGHGNIPLLPLVWALAFGACLGGNGTLIGASANVVAAGIAQQHGYSFSFMDFFKIGFPMMLCTVTVATAYLMVCHVAIGWNYS